MLLVFFPHLLKFFNLQRALESAYKRGDLVFRQLEAYHVGTTRKVLSPKYCKHRLQLVEGQIHKLIVLSCSKKSQILISLTLAAAGEAIKFLLFPSIFHCAMGQKPAHFLSTQNFLQYLERSIALTTLPLKHTCRWMRQQEEKCFLGLIVTMLWQKEK